MPVSDIPRILDKDVALSGYKVPAGVSLSLGTSHCFLNLGIVFETIILLLELNCIHLFTT